MTTDNSSISEMFFSSSFTGFAMSEEAPSCIKMIRSTMLKGWNDVIAQNTFSWSLTAAVTGSKASVSSKKYYPMINDALNSHHTLSFTR